MNTINDDTKLRRCKDSGSPIQPPTRDTDQVDRLYRLKETIAQCIHSKLAQVLEQTKPIVICTKDLSRLGSFMKIAIQAIHGLLQACPEERMSSLEFIEYQRLLIEGRLEGQNDQMKPSDRTRVADSIIRVLQFKSNEDASLEPTYTLLACLCVDFSPSVSFQEHPISEPRIHRSCLMSDPPNPILKSPRNRPLDEKKQPVVVENNNDDDDCFVPQRKETAPKRTRSSSHPNIHWKFDPVYSSNSQPLNDAPHKRANTHKTNDTKRSPKRVSTLWITLAVALFVLALGGWFIVSYQLDTSLPADDYVGDDEYYPFEDEDIPNEPNEPKDTPSDTIDELFDKIGFLSCVMTGWNVLNDYVGVDVDVPMELIGG